MGELGRTGFWLDLDEGRLWRGRQPIYLAQKAFKLCVYFANNPGRLLRKEEILRNLWPGVHVSSSLVKEYVHDLRRALQDDPKRPRFIETVPGQGYRFIGSLEIRGGRSPGAATRQLSATPLSVAVLTIQNLTCEERWRPFCRGLTNDIITELACSAATVVPPAMLGRDGDTCDACHSELARKLMVDHILVGSLQADESRLRLNLHLNQVKSGNTVWAERFEGVPAEALRLQNAITVRLRQLFPNAQDVS